MGNISEHFDTSEFACSDGCGFDTPKCRLVIALEELRVDVGKPIKLNSGCRCARRNHEIGGHPESYHTKGMAADCRVPGMSLLALYYKAICVKDFFQGSIGVYPPWKDSNGRWRGNFLHLEVRQNPRYGRWAQYKGVKIPLDRAIQILKEIEKQKTQVTVMVNGG